VAWAAFRLQFEWDPWKEQVNVHKHAVSFVVAATVLNDPLALTRFDADHSAAEDRWFTIGRAVTHELLVVVHTWEDLDATTARVRIISARSATGSERKSYEENA
jgi:uncharacterized DUF497 family protein